MTPADECGQFHPPTDLQSPCQNRCHEGAKTQARAVILSSEGDMAACRTKLTRQCGVDTTGAVCRGFDCHCGYCVEGTKPRIRCRNYKHKPRMQLHWHAACRYLLAGRRHIAQPRVRRWERPAGRYAWSEFTKSRSPY